MTKITNLFALATLSALAIVIGAGAVQAAPTQAQQDAIRSSCQTDYRKYCASVPTGGSAALQCLEKNVASLSSSCQQAVNAVSGGGSSSSTTSTAPATTTTEPAATTTAPAAAAPAPAAPASPPPAPITMQPREEIALMRQACGADYRSHCAGVRIIGGGALSCLLSHASSLSQSCKSELSKLGQRF
jgi:hypothetical protein